jgi:hypothetical protein
VLSTRTNPAPIPEAAAKSSAAQTPPAATIVAKLSSKEDPPKLALAQALQQGSKQAEVATTGRLINVYFASRAHFVCGLTELYSYYRCGAK